MGGDPQSGETGTRESTGEEEDVTGSESRPGCEFGEGTGSTSSKAGSDLGLISALLGRAFCIRLGGAVFGEIEEEKHFGLNLRSVQIRYRRPKILQYYQCF